MLISEYINDDSPISRYGITIKVGDYTHVITPDYSTCFRFYDEESSPDSVSEDSKIKYKNCEKFKEEIICENVKKKRVKKVVPTDNTNIPAKKEGGRITSDSNQFNPESSIHDMSRKGCKCKIKITSKSIEKPRVHEKRIDKISINTKVKEDKKRNVDAENNCKLKSGNVHKNLDGFVNGSSKKKCEGKKDCLDNKQVKKSNGTIKKTLIENGNNNNSSSSPSSRLRKTRFKESVVKFKECPSEDSQGGTQLSKRRELPLVPSLGSKGKWHDV